MNEKKQLDCQLNCKATATLAQSVQLELDFEDRNLQEILNGQDQNQEDSSDCSNN